jgi:hypothetical protein
MNSAQSATMTSRKSSGLRTQTRAWSRLPVLAALSVACAIATGATSRAPEAVDASGSLPIHVAQAVGGDDVRDLRNRCAWCGRVQSIRRIETTATEPLSFEFTVRLYGGAIHSVPSATEGSWLAGDRIILVGAMTPPR